MFLRNYDNLLLAHQLCSTELVEKCVSNAYVNIGTSTENKGDGYLNGTTPSGSVVLFSDCFANSSNSDYRFPLLAFSSASICLGQGNVPVDYDDIKLSGSVVTNNLTQTSNTLTYDESTCSWKRTVVASCANPSSSAITISEWGIFRLQNTMSASTIYSNASANCVLLYREVLEEPIVIEAGTTAELTFTLEIPMPNHP